MDRDELEERVRRRPAEGGFRRGQQIDESPASAGYVPFQPEPEDALAVRPESGDPGTYTGPPGGAAGDPPEIEPPAQYREPEPPAYAAPPPPPPVPDAPDDEIADEYRDEYDDRPYGEPEDAYAYPYAAPVDRGGGAGGGSALPIIGFVVLCVLALAVGAVLAGLFSGEDQVGQATPTPSASSLPATPEPTAEPTIAPTDTGAPATPEPTDGPVTFADGAVYEVQPCATYEYKSNLTGCKVDGTTLDSGSAWILVVFDNAKGTDDIVLQLRSAGETLDRQEKTLGSIVNCRDTCGGLIWGAVYKDLLPGQYQLVLRRNGDFADTATFTVGG